MSNLTKLIDQARATVEVAGDVSPVLLAKVTYELEQALEGLYRVYVNLGEDTDGARNARELFGPWVGFDPATHVPNLVAETRKQWGDDYEADLEKAYDEGVEIGRYYAEDMTYAPLSPYRWRSNKND